MVSWVDDIMAVGHPDDVKEMKADLKKVFACECKGELKEYIGSKVDLTCNENGFGRVKVTRSVLVQKLEESFNIAGGKHSKTPTLVGQILVRGDGSDMFGPVETTELQSGTAICLFITQ